MGNKSNKFSVMIISLILFTTTGCVTTMRMEGSSMRPGIEDQERLLINTSVGEIKRGDIIVFKYPKDTSKLYLKRVVGLPGETIEIKDGTVFIEGVQLKEDYVNEEDVPSDSQLTKTHINNGHYFVMGDNREFSSDSRAWGTVDHSLIQGKLYMKY